MAATTVLAAALCPPGPPRAGWVAIDDGIVVEVGDGPAPVGAVELGDRVLAPGFVDLQVNGVGRVDFVSASTDDWHRATITLAAHGVTGCCPTFVSTSRDAYAELLDRSESARHATRPGESVLLGAHLEGPFLGDAPGAHPTEHLGTADPGWVSELVDRRPGAVRMVTLAPESDPGFATTRLLTDRGVIVALGHSRASYADAIAAADAGARVVTHLFNAMSPLHHREPGLVGAALDDDRLTPTVVADLVHVHPAALRLAIRRKPNVAVVSDSVATTHAAPPRDAVRTPDGRLAGATALLDRAVANLLALGLPVERAVTMASSVPAAVLGLDDRGRIHPGGRADLVALDPRSWTVAACWVGGVRAATERSSVGP